MEYVQRKACFSIPHHVEMDTQDHCAPNALHSKPFLANFVTRLPPHSHLHHYHHCHLSSKPHTVDSLDKVVPMIVDGCLEYVFVPQYLYRLGPQLLHLIWTLNMQYAHLIASLGVEVVPARDGVPPPTLPYLPPCALPLWQQLGAWMVPMHGLLTCTCCLYILRFWRIHLRAVSKGGCTNKSSRRHIKLQMPLDSTHSNYKKHNGRQPKCQFVSLDHYYDYGRFNLLNNQHNNFIYLQTPTNMQKEWIGMHMKGTFKVPKSSSWQQRQNCYHINPLFSHKPKRWHIKAP